MVSETLFKNERGSYMNQEIYPPEADDEDDEVDNGHARTCPICNTLVIPQGRCLYCPICGWSACTV